MKIYKYWGIEKQKIMIDGTQQDETEMALTAGEGMKLGVLVFGLLRAIASLGEEK